MMGRLMRPDLDTEEIVRRYQRGESSKLIAADLGCGSRTVVLRLQSAGVAMRQRGKVKTYPNGHPNWKGNHATYCGFHARVNAKRGRPSQCERCGTTEPRVYHWANLTGNYADPSDYARMCVPCHKRFDMARNPKEPWQCKRGHPLSEALRRSDGRIHHCRACRRDQYAATVDELGVALGAGE